MRLGADGSMHGYSLAKSGRGLWTNYTDVASPADPEFDSPPEEAFLFFAGRPRRQVYEVPSSWPPCHGRGGQVDETAAGQSVCENRGISRPLFGTSGASRTAPGTRNGFLKSETAPPAALRSALARFLSFPRGSNGSAWLGPIGSAPPELGGAAAGCCAALRPLITVWLRAALPAVASRDR